jgi:hypothetical protein
MAKMLGVWMDINNPNRSPSEDLNLTVGGTIWLSSAELAKVPPGGLFNVKIKVMDSDSFSDDLVHSDNSFSIGVRSDNQPFMTGVIVPAGALKNSEPSYENSAEVYCRVAASNGTLSTNASNSGTVGIRIR